MLRLPSHIRLSGQMVHDLAGSMNYSFTNPRQDVLAESMLFSKSSLHTAAEPVKLRSALQPSTMRVVHLKPRFLAATPGRT
jgi:hypothetical protein